MFESKYSKVLTAILIIVIVAILGLLGFLAYDYYQKATVTADTADFVDNFENQVANGQGETQNDGDEDSEDPLSEIQQASTGGNGASSTKVTYKGYGVLGTMEIPATNFKYPILEAPPTTKKLNTSVVYLFGTAEGINKPGNVVIVGHNYRNGLFFSNNKKLNIGDKIYVSDNSGNKLTYTIYNKFETTPEDTSFYQRDTGGKAELTLSTCTDDSKARTIILAKED